MPGIIKVGFTTKPPHLRARELHSTGVPTPFAVAWARECIDPRAVEYLAHQALDKCRVSGKREFFRCDVRTAVKVINKVADGYLRRRYRRPLRWGSMMFGLWKLRAMLFVVAALISVAWAIKTGNMYRLAYGATHLLISLSYLHHR
jgi:hypothetical protein